MTAAIAKIILALSIVVTLTTTSTFIYLGGGPFEKPQFFNVEFNKNITLNGWWINSAMPKEINSYIANRVDWDRTFVARKPTSFYGVAIEPNFQEFAYIFLTKGEQTSGGYNIGINSINYKNGSLFINYYWKVPTGPAPAMMTYPYCFVELPKNRLNDYIIWNIIFIQQSIPP